MQLRVASFNILHGMALHDGRVDPDRLADAVKALDADVLALQEVDRLQERSHRLDLARIAADAMGATDWRFLPALIGTPGQRWRAADPREEASDQPAYGIALLSRLPVERWHAVHLPPSPLPAPVLVSRPGRRRHLLLLHDDEPRAGLAAVVRTGPTNDRNNVNDTNDTSHPTVTVAGTHLSYVPAWNLRQLLLLRRELRRLPGQRIVLGDFNLPGRLPAAVLGWPDSLRAPTFPLTDPKTQLDHILVEPGPLTVHSTRTVDLGLSDHRAIVADLVSGSCGTPTG